MGVVKRFEPFSVSSGMLFLGFPRRLIMHEGKFIFSQVMNHLPMHIFRRCCPVPGYFPM
jgi:hypothetical protein